MDNLHFFDGSISKIFVAKNKGRNYPNPCMFDLSMYFFCMQGEYYNQDEIQTMVTAEVLEEERKKKEENAQLDASMVEAEVAEQAEIEKSKKKRRKGPMVAA